MVEDKEEIIKQLREKGVGFNPNSRIETLKKLLDDTANVPPVEPLEITKEESRLKPEEGHGQLVEMLSGIAKSIGAMESRVAKLEGKPSVEYRLDAKEADITKAQETKKDLDPRIVQIVEESLGTDFAIEIQPFEDKPGFLFRLVVPERLSDRKPDSRPVMNPSGEGYLKDKVGNIVQEMYIPEDRRSIAIGSMQSYTAIREHCDRVREYIVAYYQKTRQPLPEFKVK